MVKKFSIWLKFQICFPEANDCEDCWRKKNIVKKLLLFKISKLVDFTNRHGEKSEIIASSPYKRKLQQDQEEITETNKN